MFHRKSLKELRAKLDSTNAAIARHPLASGRMTRAHAVVESTGSGDKDLVNEKLHEENLPGLVELGKTQVRHSFSWWKLHRNRNKIVKQLEKYGS